MIQTNQAAVDWLEHQYDQVVKQARELQNYYASQRGIYAPYKDCVISVLGGCTVRVARPLMQFIDDHPITGNCRDFWLCSNS